MKQLRYDGEEKLGMQQQRWQKTTTTNDDDDKHLKYYLFLFDWHYCYAMMIIGNVNSILKCDNKKNEPIQTIYW